MEELVLIREVKLAQEENNSNVLHNRHKVKSVAVQSGRMQRIWQHYEHSNVSMGNSIG